MTFTAFASAPSCSQLCSGQKLGQVTCLGFWETPQHGGRPPISILQTLGSLSQLALWLSFP